MTKTHSRSTSLLKSNDNTRSTLPARRVEPTSQTSPQQDELGRLVPDKRQPSLPPPSNGTLNRNISLQTSDPPQPLHPEIRSVVSLTHVHAHKIYMSGPLILRIERLPGGYQPIEDEAWRDVWAQLGGTTLCIWDMKEIEEASKQGKEVPPTYTNVTDAFVQVLGLVTIPASGGVPAQKYNNVVSLNTAGSNLLLFSCPNSASLISWATALRVSSWEKSHLEEIYTAHLIRITLNDGRNAPSSLVRGRREGWVRIRISGQTGWEHLWMSVSSGQAPDSPPQPTHGKRRISFFGREDHQSQQQFKSSVVAFYPSPKPKDRKKAFLTLQGVTQAFAVYPERPELINKSSLMKIEGKIGREDAAMNMRGREGWVLVMPELEPGVPQANETIRWLIAFHDSFSLYGRPRAYSWDPRDLASMMFAYPAGPSRDSLFLEREAAEVIDPREDRTSAIRTRLNNILSNRMQGLPATPSSLSRNAPISQSPLPSINEPPKGTPAGDSPLPQLPPLGFGSSDPEEMRRTPTPIVEASPAQRDPALPVIPGTPTARGGWDDSSSDEEEEEEEEEEDVESDGQPESFFAPSKNAMQRKARSEVQQATHEAAAHRPGRGAGKTKSKSKARGGWEDSSDEEEEEEDVDSDGQPVAPRDDRSVSNYAASANNHRSQYSLPRGPSPLASGDTSYQPQPHTRPPRDLPPVPLSRPQGHDEDSSRYRQSGQYDGGRKSYHEDGASHSGTVPYSQIPTHAPAPTPPRHMWSQVLDPGHAPGAVPDVSNPRETFIQLESPARAMTKAFTPHGLLSAGLQDKEDRSAKRQEELAREAGASLVNVSNKPPPPQTGLFGAITAHERDRKRDGGVGAALTEDEREKLLAEERQSKLDDLQRQQLEYMQQGGSMYGQQQSSGFNPIMNPMMTGMKPMMTRAPFLFDSHTPPRSRPHSPVTFSEPGASHESDGVDVITPTLTWSNQPMPKRTIPIEQTEGYINTRSHAIEAIGDAFSTVARIGHEALSTGVDLLQFAPVPGLQLAANILLNICDTVGMVKTNRVAALRLTERCEEILTSIRDEIADMGDTVAEELHAPTAKLVKAFRGVQDLLNKLSKRPFLKRYLGRDEIQSSISSCDAALSDALGMFHFSIHVRTLKLVQANELRRQKDTPDLLESPLYHFPATGLPPVQFPLPPAVLQSSSPADPESVHKTLDALRVAQNAQDRACDAADLRRLMRTALDAKDDLAMFEVFQIARSEMPDAIKTLERAFDRVVECGRLDTEESTTALSSPPQEEAGNGDRSSVELSDRSPSPCSADTLDRKFIQSGIDALRRLSKCTDLRLPSWTITRFEIDLEAKVGVGFFSDVYRGTWRKHTVAIKRLAETTPRKVFLREVEIWQSLYHPNVLELFGASSASGEPPWFLVSKYHPRGSLVKYLKGLSDADAVSVDALKMIHEISEGMAYLHKKDVLHGDLKAANILVDDDTCCVISDFGQSEMKSEVYRITRASQPRGTLRWQAPEIMEGAAQMLTPEMDVYAFAICCWEILKMGALPYTPMDDDTVRHLVLYKNMRPELPPSNLVNSQLISVIHASWDRDPSNRPSFEQISHKLKKQRAERQLADAYI